MGFESFFEWRKGIEIVLSTLAVYQWWTSKLYRVNLAESHAQNAETIALINWPLDESSALRFIFTGRHLLRTDAGLIEGNLYQPASAAVNNHTTQWSGPGCRCCDINDVRVTWRYCTLNGLTAVPDNGRRRSMQERSADDNPVSSAPATANMIRYGRLLMQSIGLRSRQKFSQT